MVSAAYDRAELWKDNEDFIIKLQAYSRMYIARSAYLKRKEFMSDQVKERCLIIDYTCTCLTEILPPQIALCYLDFVRYDELVWTVAFITVLWFCLEQVLPFFVIMLCIPEDEVVLKFRHLHFQVELPDVMLEITWHCGEKVQIVILIEVCKINFSDTNPYRFPQMRESRPTAMESTTVERQLHRY